MIACIETFTAGIAMRWFSLKSLIDLIDGSRTISISGDTLRPATPLTSTAIPLVFDQIVMMPGIPSETKSTEPEISASFITSEERKVAHSVVMSRPGRLGVLLDQLQILHHHVLHVGDAELLGDANHVRLGARGAG